MKRLTVETLDQYRLRQAQGQDKEQGLEQNRRVQSELLDSATSLKDYDKIRRVQDRLIYAEPGTPRDQMTLRDYIVSRNAEEAAAYVPQVQPGTSVTEFLERRDEEE